MQAKKISKVYVLMLGLIILIPLLLLFLWSLIARWPWPDLLPTTYTLRGFKDLFIENQKVWKVILSSIALSLCVATLSVIISLMSSRYLFISGEKIRQRMTFIFQLPNLIPATIFAMGIHLPMIQWGISDTNLGVLIVHLVYAIPYAFLLIHPVYDSIGEALEEQAMILGASPFQAFTKITLPLLLPVLFTALAMSFIVSFSQYFLTLVIGGGRVQTYMTIIFPYFQNNDRTIAAVYSMLFLFITLIFFAIMRLCLKSLQRHYQTFQYYDS